MVLVSRQLIIATRELLPRFVDKLIMEIIWKLLFVWVSSQAYEMMKLFQRKYFLSSKFMQFLLITNYGNVHQLSCQFSGFRKFQLIKFVENLLKILSIALLSKKTFSISTNLGILILKRHVQALFDNQTSHNE